MVLQGECARIGIRKEILLFVSDEKKHYKHEFVDSIVQQDGKCAKGTLFKYLDELIAEGYITKEPGPKTKSFRAVYSIAPKGLIEIRRIENRNLVDSIDGRFLKPLRNLLIKLKQHSHDRDRFLEYYFFTFIGNIPIAVSKSVTSVESHLAFEKNLRERHMKAIREIDEEALGDKLVLSKQEFARKQARIQEEVGWNLGDYFEKLLKKTEKDDKFTRMLKILGIDEDVCNKL
jgi:DNA-binding PadR family transcriptional regulator